MHSIISNPVPVLSQEGSMHFDHWWLLIANPLNFSHKVACAAVLGVYGLTAKSWEQLGILIALQQSARANQSVCQTWEALGNVVARHQPGICIGKQLGKPTNVQQER
eukprot:1138161-Pelagomonas_calceolata.AAC.3